MNKAHFDKVFSEFIQQGGEEKVTPKSFFQILAEIEREHVERTIELRAKIVEGQLRFDPSSEISVHDNEIILGDQRIVVKML